MSFAVVAKFPCKPGQVDAMGELFEAALSDTRGFACCERIDVVLNEPLGTYLLVEYWDQESSYDTYLQWRTDTGIAEVLAPLIEGGGDGILGSVNSFGIMQDISFKTESYRKYLGST